MNIGLITILVVMVVIVGGITTLKIIAWNRFIDNLFPPTPIDQLVKISERLISATADQLRVIKYPTINEKQIVVLSATEDQTTVNLEIPCKVSIKLVNKKKGFLLDSPTTPFYYLIYRPNPQYWQLLELKYHKNTALLESEKTVSKKELEEIVPLLM